jgi:hypothetical protein
MFTHIFFNVDKSHRVQPKMQDPGIYAGTTVKATPAPRFFVFHFRKILYAG